LRSVKRIEEERSGDRGRVRGQRRRGAESEEE